MHGGGKPFLVQTPTRRLYAIDGDLRRQVKAGMLFAALTRVLGTPRQVSDNDLERWSPGPPVEVLESDSGPAFVVIGGRRLPLRGLPLPYLVSSEDMLLFPEGEELNIAALYRPAARSRGARARQVLENGWSGTRQRQAGARGSSPDRQVARSPLAPRRGADPYSAAYAVRGVGHGLQRNPHRLACHPHQLVA